MNIVINLILGFIGFNFLVLFSIFIYVFFLIYKEVREENLKKDYKYLLYFTEPNSFFNNHPNPIETKIYKKLLNGWVFFELYEKVKFFEDLPNSNIILLKPRHSKENFNLFYRYGELEVIAFYYLGDFEDIDLNTDLKMKNNLRFVFRGFIEFKDMSNT